jgi:hypothetical protein
MSKSKKTGSISHDEIRKTEERRVKIGVPVRSDLWRELRALSIKQDRLTGELLDEAIEEYLNKSE